MYLMTVKTRVQLWYECGDCIMLIGPSGVGKTDIARWAAKFLSNLYKKNLGCVVVNCPRLNVPDSIGFLIPRTMPDGSLRSQFTLPDYFVTEEGKLLSEYDGGIIIFDEYDKADIDVKKILVEAMLERRFGPHRIPDGWVIWMTANRMKDRTGSTKDFDNAINRRQEVPIQPHFESWEEWAIEHEVLDVIKAFAKHNQTIVFSDDPPKVQGPWATARSVSRFNNYYALATKFNGGVQPTDPHIREEAAGRLGVAEAGQFFETVELLKILPDTKDVFRAPKSIPVPERVDGKMLVTYALASQVEASTAEAAITYMERMPKEFSITFVNSAIKRDAHLIMPMRKWIQANHHLVTLISQAV